jgi:hypothetical protein
MPCKQGTRESIEKAKVRNRKDREYDPWRALWTSLVNRVYHTDASFGGLTSDEQIYYTLRVLEGEVYNGGICQFFDNSSGAHYKAVVENLKLLQAPVTLSLLLQTKTLLFGTAEPPQDRQERYSLMRKGEEVDVALEALSEAYWKDPDKLGEKLDDFAVKAGLVDPFLVPKDSSQ